MNMAVNEVLPPPVKRYRDPAASKKNLFQNWFSALATFLMLYLFYAAGRES